MPNSATQSANYGSVPSRELFGAELGADAGIGKSVDSRSPERQWGEPDHKFVEGVNQNIDIVIEHDQKTLQEMIGLELVSQDLVDKLKSGSLTDQESRFMDWKENNLHVIKLFYDSGIMSDKELVESLEELRGVGLDEF